MLRPVELSQQRPPAWWHCTPARLNCAIGRCTDAQGGSHLALKQSGTGSIVSQCRAVLIRQQRLYGDAVGVCDGSKARDHWGRTAALPGQQGALCDPNLSSCLEGAQTTCHPQLMQADATQANGGFGHAFDVSYITRFMPEYPYTVSVGYFVRFSRAGVRWR